MDPSQRGTRRPAAALSAASDSDFNERAPPAYRLSAHVHSLGIADRTLLYFLFCASALRRRLISVAQPLQWMQRPPARDHISTHKVSGDAPEERAEAREKEAQAREKEAKKAGGEFCITLSELRIESWHQQKSW